MLKAIRKKIIATELDEKQFLLRMDKFCVPYRTTVRGYELSGMFAAKVRKNRFWFARRSFAVLNKDLLENEFLFGKYSVGNDGKVTVAYRIGHRPMFLIPMCLMCLAGVTLLFSGVCDTVLLHAFQTEKILISVSLTAVSLFELLYYPKSQTEALENHLEKICRSEE